MTINVLQPKLLTTDFLLLGCVSAFNYQTCHLSFSGLISSINKVRFVCFIILSAILHLFKSVFFLYKIQTLRFHYINISGNKEHKDIKPMIIFGSTEHRLNRKITTDKLCCFSLSELISVTNSILSYQETFLNNNKTTITPILFTNFYIAFEI